MRTTSLGQHLNLIVAWALAFRTSAEYGFPYLTQSQNGAGVAVKALCAGGADAFSPLGSNPTSGTLFMTAAEARLWAQGVAQGIGQANDCLSRLNVLQTLQSPGTDLPTANEWRNNSAVPLMLRGSIARAIATALGIYQPLNWAADFPTKLAALVTIIRLTRDYFDDSERDRDDYKVLAGCIMSVVATVAALSTPAWNGASFYGTARRNVFMS